MEYKWTDKTKQYVQCENKFIPVDERNMDWIELKTKIEAGEITIEEEKQ